MEDLYIYGAGKVGRGAQVKIESLYHGYVKGFCDTYKTGSYSERNIIPLNKISDNATLVIANDYPKSMTEMYRNAKKHGIKNIYWYLNLDDIPKEKKGFLEDECMKINNWGEEILPDLEVHIADNCNLNCRGCTHFSPLFRTINVDYQNRIEDIEKVRNKVSNISRLDILGGEPLLNDELKNYIVDIRKLLPDTRINVFTNGILIPAQEKSLFETMRSENVYFMISEYPVLSGKIQEIRELLYEEGIRYQITPIRNEFNLPLSLSVNSKHDQLCISNGCVCVRDGKIGRCPTLMYVYKFNEHYGKNLPETGILSLDDPLRGRELLDFLEKPVELCKYCVKNPITWSQCEKTYGLDCFAVED